MQNVCGILDERPGMLMYDYDLCGGDAGDEDIEIPESYKLPSKLIPTCGDQEWTGMCAAFAFAGIIEALWAKETGEKVKHSPLFAYGYLRNESQRELVGTYVSQLMKRACLLGTVPESMMPGIMENPHAYDYVHSHPDIDELVVEAARRRIAGYAKFRQGNFEERVKAMKRAILKYQIPLFGDFLVSGMGHGVVIVGWKKDKWLYMNSYGVHVGDKGICSKSYDKLRAGYIMYDAANLPKFPFVDVPEWHWAYHAISRCYYAGIVNGVDEGHFAPEDNLTRAQVAQALYRLAQRKADFDGVELTFRSRNEYKDVNAVQWYSEACGYCSSKEIFADIAGAEFFPDKPILRGEFSNVVCRFIGTHCKKILPGDVTLMTFSDVGREDAYYIDIVDCCSLGLVNGMGDGTFKPDGNLTRSQLCQVLYKLIKLIEEREV